MDESNPVSRYTAGQVVPGASLPGARVILLVCLHTHGSMDKSLLSAGYFNYSTEGNDRLLECFRSARCDGSPLTKVNT